MHWLKHAFAVEKPGIAEPTEQQRAAVEHVCRAIVRRRLTTGALVCLEMARPLNFVGAQALHVLAPLLSMFSASNGHRELALFLERRGSIEFLCRRIETLEAEATARDAGTSLQAEVTKTE